MKKTKIDWCDSTWNPVTGCMHGCEYCYARSMAKRFAGYTHDEDKNPVSIECSIGIQELDRPKYIGMPSKLRKAPYPFNFTPTLHHYKLNEPKKWITPRNIFVCSMADLFGEWVPDEWIDAVFDACAAAPQHLYLFLTKNPARLLTLGKAGKLPMGRNMWYGTSITRHDQQYFYSAYHHCFLSIEPIHEDFGKGEIDNGVEWVIVGAETGNRKGRIIPKKGWIDNIAEICAENDIPLFMKESLCDLMGDDFRQKFPWEANTYER